MGLKKSTKSLRIDHFFNDVAISINANLSEMTMSTLVEFKKYIRLHLILRLAFGRFLATSTLS